MSQVKCIDTRGYALTENEKYDVVERDDKYIKIVNDNGNTARYHKDMFSAVRASKTAPEIVAPPVVIERTEQDCINSIVNDGFNTKYTGLNNQLVTITNNLYGTDPGNNLSCGVKAIVNLNSQIDSINMAVNADQNKNGDDLIALQKALLKSHIINFIKQKAQINGDQLEIVLMSTNINHDEDLITVMDEICHFSSEEVQNPNSGNIIKLWGFHKSKL